MGRNRPLIPGVRARGRAASKGFRGHKFSKKVTAAKPKAEAAAPAKQPRWYAADDVKKPLKSRKNHHHQTRLRPSITPGTVLILLAGRFRGRRVVFLKQLESGLLLVTGPFKLNGVPLRRVNQAYVIGTSTKVDIAGVDTKEITDASFPKKKAEKPKKTGEQFFKAPEQKVEVTKEKKDFQKKIDGAVVAAVEKTPNLSAYLGAKFSLTNNDKPHLMRF